MRVFGNGLDTLCFWAWCVDEIAVIPHGKTAEIRVFSTPGYSSNPSGKNEHFYYLNLLAFLGSAFLTAFLGLKLLFHRQGIVESSSTEWVERKKIYLRAVA